ncbi:MAG TPA: hypothetical protein VG817_06705, partial [Gemmatimonadales bacterium]|nr:hypothetical protein [Gemmatimonadales bacterium]
PGMDSALLQGLEKDPAARFASCGDFARALDRRSSAQRVVARTRIRWSPVVLVALLLPLITVLVLWCRSP